jgi:glutamate N-acetyltransferase/amino-acid N-acetyltransferase
MYKVKGGITAPLGFKQAAVNSGIKKKKLDLALIYSVKPANTCGLFTTNKFKAAPVLLCKSRLRARCHRAVIINSGNANCLTGKKGLDDARDITSWLALLLGIKKEEVLACSTGIIGKRLPVKKIIGALAGLVNGLSKDNFGIAARAIMTTDTVKKELSLGFKVGKKEVRLGGIAKGAGMIEPNLATMLSVITTDANISKGLLRAALKEAVDNSFNCVTVDGSMSTNDTVLAFANSASGVDVGSSRAVYKKFVACLSALCSSLAKMIAGDGEGATKFIGIEVKNAKDKADAKKVALAIANSPLFKTMCYG